MVRKGIECQIKSISLFLTNTWLIGWQKRLAFAPGDDHNMNINTNHIKNDENSNEFPRFSNTWHAREWVVDWQRWVYKCARKHFGIEILVYLLNVHVYLCAKGENLF